MDDNRYPSLRNNFTLDQITRMRQVMEKCQDVIMVWINKGGIRER